MKRGAFIPLALFLFASPTLRAQAPQEEQPPQQQQQPQPQPQKPPLVPTISGSEHPELIPDSRAYFIIFNFLSQNVGDPEKERVWLRAPGLSDDDTEVLLRIMNSYRKDFDPIVKTYNETNEKAYRETGQPPDPSISDNFKTRCDELVAATRKDLDEALSPAGAAHFRNYVQSQKRNMTISVEKPIELHMETTPPPASAKPQ